MVQGMAVQNIIMGSTEAASSFQAKPVFLSSINSCIEGGLVTLMWRCTAQHDDTANFCVEGSASCPCMRADTHCEMHIKQTTNVSGVVWSYKSDRLPQNSRVNIK